MCEETKKGPSLPQIRMKRPNLDGLPPWPDLAPGYDLRSAREEDASILADLMAVAFNDNGWTPQRVLEQLLGNPACQKTFVIVKGHHAVATATLLLEPEQHPGSGILHWVAANPSHHGKKLGLAVSLAVLHAAKELGCKYSLLLTDDWRLPAIKTYLRLGYEPDCWHESHKARWQEILKKIG